MLLVPMKILLLLISAMAILFSITEERQLGLHVGGAVYIGFR